MELKKRDMGNNNICFRGINIHRNLFKVSDNLRKCESEIKIIKREMIARNIYDGWLSTSAAHFDIKVSPSGLSRSLRILDTLIKLFKLLGYEIKNCGSTSLIVLGQYINIRMREKRKKKYVINSKGRKIVDYMPTGKLSITIGYVYGEVFKDGKLPLENQLEEIIRYIESEAETRYQHQLNWEEAKRKEREEHELKVEIERRQQVELINTTTLVRQAVLAYISDIVKKYIDQVEYSSVQDAEYILWARNKTNWINPHINCEDPILENMHKNQLLSLLIGRF